MAKLGARTRGAQGDCWAFGSDPGEECGFKIDSSSFLAVDVYQQPKFGPVCSDGNRTAPRLILWTSV